jgi:hypothetical protein
MEKDLGEQIKNLFNFNDFFSLFTKYFTLLEGKIIFTILLIKNFSSFYFQINER